MKLKKRSQARRRQRPRVKRRAARLSALLSAGSALDDFFSMSCPRTSSESLTSRNGSALQLHGNARRLDHWVCGLVCGLVREICPRLWGSWMRLFALALSSRALSLALSRAPCLSCSVSPLSALSCSHPHPSTNVHARARCVLRQARNHSRRCTRAEGRQEGRRHEFAKVDLYSVHVLG